MKKTWLNLEAVIIIGLSLKLVLTGAFLVLDGGQGRLFQPRLAHAQEQPAAPPQAAPAASDAGMTEQYRQMLEALKLREQAMKKKDERLDEREKALAALETELKKKMAELDETRKQLNELVKKNAELVQEQQILKNARIEHLVSAYKSMRPESAGALVNSLDDNVAVQILAAMPGRSAGQILANVEPVKAARLTKAISIMKSGQPGKDEKAPAGDGAAQPAKAATNP